MAQAIHLRWPQIGEFEFAADPMQRAVIAHRHGHLRVLAGPGTGKTSVIVASVLERLRLGQPAESMLILTYGRMAAEELRQRLASASRVVPVASTFHSLAHRLMQGQPQAPRLLGSPEQEAMLREIIRGSKHLPEELEIARESRGLAEQLRSYIVRAQSSGQFPSPPPVDSDPLEVAAHAIFAEYLDVLGFSGSTDYADLIRRATDFVRTDPPREVLALQTVFVDEYQDTDPAQVAMLKGLTAHGAQVIAVGDPDQSIYGFRGADVGGILRFAEDFSHPQCQTIALGSTRRYGPTLAAVARRVVPGNALAGIPAQKVHQHRNPDPLADAPGQFGVRLYESEAAQADHIADLLRRVHAGCSEVFPDLRLDWSQMAVLVRSGTRDLPALQRSLLAAGIPVEIAADDIPLAANVAVQPLLDVLRVAAGVDGGLTPARAASLLTSPLCGLDAQQLTALGRFLRRRSVQAGEQPKPSPQLIVQALLDPEQVAKAPEDIAAPVAELGSLLDMARERVVSNVPASRILDEVWRSTRWGQRLRAQALGGGQRSREANLALDALVELFDRAEQSDRAFESVHGAQNFLQQIDEQVIPAAPNRQRLWNRNAVRLVTAHRAKGSQWPLVVVAGVQEGLWPDVRSRVTLFGDPLADSEALGWREAQMLDERRLFFVACTRASRALLVTAVRSTSDDGPEPSSFVALAAGDAVPVEVSGRPLRPLTPVGVVAALRQELMDPDATDAMRQAVWERLADLAGRNDSQGRPIFPWASSRTWWGHRQWTQNPQPWFDPDQPLALSASAVERYVGCPRRWFLERKAQASSTATTNMAFGNVLHLCAQAVAAGDIEADEQQIGEVLDSVWQAVGYEPGWQERFEREEAQQATRRLLTWLRHAPGTLVAAEEPFEEQLTLDADEVVTVRGKADRVDRVGDQLVITDFKTGSQPPSRADVEQHIQLGLYRWVGELGGLGAVGQAVAQLLFLRKDPPAKNPEDGAKLLLQDGPDVAGWLAPIIQSVASGIRGQDAPARPGPDCRYCALASSCPADPKGAEVRP